MRIKVSARPLRTPCAAKVHSVLRSNRHPIDDLLQGGTQAIALTERNEQQGCIIAMQPTQWALASLLAPFSGFTNTSVLSGKSSRLLPKWANAGPGFTVIVRSPL
mmetsp:Transcript_67726/g.188993  ORF Transcript_67726/g.188993 Transcript_67726/m.188993 type:complete len:105 (+) Transcript_67726:899-1213(+)